jgi:hypothetical protein
VPRLHPLGGTFRAKWNPSYDKKPVTAAAIRLGQAGSKPEGRKMNRSTFPKVKRRNTTETISK